MHPHTTTTAASVTTAFCLIICLFIYLFIYLFCALTLLVERQEEHPICKN